MAGRRHSVGQISYLAATGLAGWAAVVGLTLWPLGHYRPWELSWQLAAVFVLGSLARVLAVRVFGRTTIAVDSAFYIATAFVFGTVPAAWLILLILTGDGLTRFFRGSGPVRPGEASLLAVLAQLAHNGGMPALGLLSMGEVFQIDRRFPLGDATLAWILPAFAVAFLAVHYALAGGSHWSRGAVPTMVWREFLVKVVPAELFMVPLALAMVLGHAHQGIGLFLLVGASCLAFNVVFRQLQIASDKLENRVEELKTLNEIGRSLAASLERPVLLKNISTATLRLVGQDSRFMIGALDEQRANLLVDLFTAEGDLCRQVVLPAKDGLSGWVMNHREPLLLGDVARHYHLYASSTRYWDPRYRSWMGVPLITYDEVGGVMAVQSEQKKAYTRDHLRVLRTIADQAVVALENARLYELATVDGLTRLLVRRHFDQRLQEEWGRTRRYGGSFSVGLFDLDNFKHLNDTYGHQAGDQVLRATAAVVRHNMRTADLAGRYGGEEFAFLLPRAGLAEAMTVAERIRDEIAALEVATGGHRLKVTASMGLATYPESGATEADVLVAQADEALYRAKREGKNRVVAAWPVVREDRPRDFRAS